MMTVDFCIEQATIDGVINDVVLRALLVAREDNVCDYLRLAAAQFGMFPELVAEIIAGIGIGTPLSAEERQIVRNNFIEKMRTIAEGQGD